MSQETSARTKTLSPHEVMDLVRAGIVLAITVYLSMMVPPRVWGADSPEQPTVEVESLSPSEQSRD